MVYLWFQPLFTKPKFIKGMSRNYKFHDPAEEGLGYRHKDYIYSSEKDYNAQKGALDNVIVIN